MKLQVCTRINLVIYLFFQVHGKDAVLSYDSDEESISETTSPSHTSNPLSSPASEPHNNNNNSSHITQPHTPHTPQQPSAPSQVQHHTTSASLAPSSASLTGLSSHFNGAHHNYYHNQMTTYDFKPHNLTDWYSTGMTHLGGMSRYDPTAVSAKPSHHVTAALPTPPSTGHSPIQSLSNHLHLLPSTTTAYT